MKDFPVFDPAAMDKDEFGNLLTIFGFLFCRPPASKNFCPKLGSTFLGVDFIWFHSRVLCVSEARFLTSISYWVCFQNIVSSESIDFRTTSCCDSKHPQTEYGTMGFPSSVQIENHHRFTYFSWCFPCKITDACQPSGYFAMWGFPKIGVPPNHPF